ncbi:hypothetical protein Tco_0509434 [Tanacetum coccineum]
MMHWNVIPSDCNQFEVVNEYDAYVVDISARTCSCRSWQLSGIPCVHAVVAMAFLNKDPETYVSNWLKKEMFTKEYNYPIKPLKGSSFWPKIDHKTVQQDEAIEKRGTDELGERGWSPRTYEEAKYYRALCEPTIRAGLTRKRMLN